MPSITYHYNPAGHLTDLVMSVGLVFDGRRQDLGNDHLDLGASEGVDDAHRLDFLAAMRKGHPDGWRALCGSGGEGSVMQRGEEGTGTG